MTPSRPATYTVLSAFLIAACRAAAQLPGITAIEESPTPAVRTSPALPSFPTRTGLSPTPTVEIPIPVDVPVISPSNVSDLVPVWQFASEDRLYRVEWSPRENWLGIGGLGEGWGVQVRGFPDLEIDMLIQDGPDDFAFSPDEASLFVGSEGGVSVWDLSLSTLKAEYRDPYDWTSTATMALSPDGATVASSVGPPLARGVFLILHIWVVATGTERLAIFEDGIGLSYQLAFRPDGREIASGSRLSGRVNFWDARTGERRGQVKGEGVAYSPDGEFIATANANSVWIWDAATKALIRELSVGGEAGEDLPLAFSPDGAMLAAGKDDLTIWSTDDWTELATWSAPAGTFHSLRFSPSGKYLGSVSGQTTPAEAGGWIYEYVATVWAVDD